MAMLTTSNAHHSALNDLYQQHHAWLRNWLGFRLNCRFDAEDLAQDTFMRILRSSNREPIQRPREFLATIAKRVMVDFIRRKTLERAYLDALAQLPEQEMPGEDERLAVLETLQEVDAMLDGLGSRAKQAFLLAQLEGLEYRDIALRLGVSLSSVKKYMAKAMEHCLLYRITHETA